MLEKLSVEFQEMALAGMLRDLGEESRVESCIVSLKFYLQRDFEDRALRCLAFPNREIYIFPHGDQFRVTIERCDDDVYRVWTFGRFKRFR